MGRKDPSDFAKRTGLVGIWKHHLADEPAEARGSEGKLLGPGLHDRKSSLRARRNRFAIELDAYGSPAPPHSLLELVAATAAHVRDAGPSVEFAKAVVVEDVAGPEWFWRGGGQSAALVWPQPASLSPWESHR